MKKKSPKEKPTKGRTTEEACKLVMCEDPITGRVVIKPSGKCPSGYMEKVMKKAQTTGITFDLGGSEEEK